MSNLFSGISGRFRGGGKNGGSKSPVPPSGNSPTSPTGPPPPQSSSSTGSFAPRVPPLPNSPSLSSTLSMNGSVASISNGDSLARLPSPKPLWLNENYAKHIVRGNFMTLSARPKTVEQGEWIAHQVVEHYQILWNFVRVITDKEEDGSTICNIHTCPRMSAGVNHSFTWLNNKKEPKEVSAIEYISLMQRWINSKVYNVNIFPTDPAGISFANDPGNPGFAAATYASGSLNTPGSYTPPILAVPTNLNTPLSQLAGPGDWIGKSSGFPSDFVATCQVIFKQMFRVYSHLYWAHFIDPFYHLSLERQLNSCFSHFILTATEIEMLDPSELGPMQPLIDLWAANGTFTKESKAYACADIRAGERLLAAAANQISVNNQ